MVSDIWASFRALPIWVQIWIALVLVPVNFASLLFLDAPNGVLIAALACFGILPNVPLMFAARGFPKSMAISHLILWPALVAILAVSLTSGASGAATGFHVVLLAVNLISLGFDVFDARHWWRSRSAPK